MLYRFLNVFGNILKDDLKKSRITVAYKNIFQFVQCHVFADRTETFEREIFVRRILISAKQFQNIFAMAITHRNSKISQRISVIDIIRALKRFQQIRKNQAR